ncbi:nucleoside hydrolase [Algicella marina]|uniref:Nucleoside hydrolase n=1 Tax=Algicella marina TaxID=2683284 RepID=A0A6P1T092_9RHOB|nr:nucleoside hydrolase [Algicella marina]QHQ36148.1 nucleoside hydrolase [Algicella marina]
MPEPRKIIIDTDPGQDDAVAILLALASPELEVLGITAVAGNVPLALTSKNVRKICELAGRPDVAVFEGCVGPLTGELVTAEYVHGATGLDGPDLPEPKMQIQAQGGVDFIVDTLRRAEPESVTIVALGPLTNVAMAFRDAPDCKAGVREIVAMGGGFFEGGNVTPTAEFNIYVDPEAADIVLRSGLPITLLPLDVTHTCLTSRQRVEAFRAIGSIVGDAVADLLDFFERFDEEKYGTDGGPLHDPCVIAWLLQPELFSGRHVNVEVELASRLTRGMTVVDWWRVTERSPNVHYIRYADSEGFFRLLTDRLAKL